MALRAARLGVPLTARDIVTYKPSVKAGAALPSSLHKKPSGGSPITPNNERLIEARRILDGLPEEEDDEVEALPEIHFRVEDKDWGDAAATRVQAAVRGRKARQSRTRSV